MYVFWFNSKNPQQIYIAKVIDKVKVKLWRNDIFPTFYRVTVDPESELYKKKEWIKVSIKEGKIYHRAFWLENEDYSKANEIVEAYFKEQRLKMERKMKKLEEFGF